MTDTDEDRVWTRFIDQNRFDSYRIATLAKIGKVEEAHEAAAYLEEFAMTKRQFASQQ